MEKNLRVHPVAPSPEEIAIQDPNDERLQDGTAEQAGQEPISLPDSAPMPPLNPAASMEPIDLPDKVPQLQQTYGSVAGSDPDHVAKVLDLSKKLNQPAAFIERSLPEAEKQAKAPSPTLLQIIQNTSPKTAKWLNDSQNMAVTHDDIPNLAKHEELVQGITQARGFTDSLNAGWQGSFTGMNARDAMPDMVVDKDAPWYNQFAAAAAGLAGDAPIMAAGAAAGLATGNPAVSMAAAFAAPAVYKSLFRQHFEKGDIQSINDLMDRGAQSLNDATKQGIIGYFSSIAGGATSALTEGSGVIAKTLLPQVAENITMTTGSNLAEGKETEPSDYLNNALLMAGMHMPSEFAQAGIEHYVEAKRTAQAAQFYKALGEAGGASKLLERLPEQYSAMLGNLTDDSPVENAYIPQEAFRTYFQSKGIDPEQAAADLGVSDSFNEASKVTGSDVSIPMKDWVTKVVKTEHYAGLANDVKFDPEGLTINQIDQRNGDIQAQMKEMEAARAKTPETPLEPTNDATQPIADKIADQLIATGMSPEDAATNAKIHEKFFQTMAERTGQDPLDLFNKYQLSIQRRDAAQAPTADGATLNQSQSPLGFVSQLETEVGKMDFKEMPAKDLANRIRNLGGIKAEELEHTGVMDWLAGKEGRVSKEEVSQYLQDQGVTVEQVMKSDSVGDTSGLVDWDEPKRDHSSDSDDIYNEVDNNMSDRHWVQERKDELRDDYVADFTDEAGNIDEKGLDEKLQEVVVDQAQKNAEDYVDSDDYYGANYVVTEGNTGWKLFGSDERGWYNPNTKENFDTDLEEAKVRLLQHMIDKGEIEGNIADVIKPSDIKWRSGTTAEAPNKSVVTRKGNALFAKERERFIKEADEYNRSSYFTDGKLDEGKTQAEFDKEVEKDAKRFARNEVEESYNDHTNAKNKVQFSIDHGIIEGSITGNDVNGYSFEIKKAADEDDNAKSLQEFPLKSKTISEAKAEAVKVLQDQKMISSGEPVADQGINTPTGPTKWKNYKVDGGENYREMLLTLPNVGPDKFKYGTHFDESNFLAHVRMTDRVDDQGRKTLYMEEMQSDWHQQGRERGYKGKDDQAKIDELTKKLDTMPDNMNFQSYMHKFHPDVPLEGVGSIKELFDTRPADEDSVGEIKEWRDYNKKVNGDQDDVRAQIKELKKAVPNAPFKNTEAWAGLALKRMIRLAVEQGYDAVAWTPADVHVARWGTDNVSWKKIADGEYRVGSVEQRGGNAGGVDIEETARRRGELLERRGEKVTTKEELRQVLMDTLNRERTDRSLDSLTDSVWKQMQENTEGEKNPRKEGMEFFYNNMLPKKVAPAVLKKLDPAAKVTVGKFEIGEDKPLESWEIPITDTMKQKVMEGQTLFQPGDNGPRAQIHIGDKGSFRIDLLKGANLSSFLHETGHFYLEVLGDLAHEENAPQQVRDDYATLLKYLGVESRDQIQTEHHETLARTFEAYLREGKAPSEALRETFGRIRDWLINIYKNLKQLNVELTPEVRGVMDRLLASDEEIRQVAKDTGYADTVSSGSPETAGKIGTLQERARQMAMDTLVKEQMKEIKASTQEELKAEREKLTVIAETRVREQVPVFKAEDELKSGGHASPVGLAQKFLDGKLDDQGQADFHAIAEVHGFASGEDLAKSMVEAKISNQFKNEVEGRVQAGMRKHDLMNDKNAMRAEAMKAIHNDRSTELLALEHQILNDLTEKKDIKGEVAKRKRLEASIDARAAKDQAVEILSTKTIKDAGNSRVYVTAERNAAAKAAGSIAKDDFEAAAKFKKQQLFNHALAAEAMKNNEEAGKALDYLDTIIKRGPDLKDMPQGFIRQADQLLSKFGFMDPRPEDLITNAKIARGMLENGQSLPDIANATGLMQAQDGRWVPEDLQSFVERVNKNYRAFEVPDSVLKSGKDYKELTMQELRDVKDTIKTIATIGKTYDRFLEAYRTMGIREAAGLFRKSIEENFGTPYAEHLQPGSTYTTRLAEILGNISEMPAALKRHLDSMLTITDNMDGGKEGPAKDNIYRPLAAAQDRESTRNYKMAQEVDAIYAKHYTPEELAKYKDTRVKIDGHTFTKENILSMALNWGNSINRERLTQGFKFDEAKFERIFDQYLDKRDWDFVQDTWNHINDSYWADLAKLEMDTKGVQPEKVEALPFDNIHGSYAGGYYPIAYDYDKSIQANQNMLEANDMWAQSSTGSAQTARGHAMARVATTKQPIRLSLDVLTRHHENMVHDLEFRRAVVDVNRFLNQTDTKTALLNAVGVKGYTGVMDWLKSAARNVSEPMSPFDQAAQWFRFKATMYMMGFRIATAPKIFLENQINAAREIGLSEAAKSVKDYYMGDNDLHETIVGKSEYMRQRATHLDRDQADIANKWRGTGQMGFQKYAFFTHAFLDQGASFPLWNNVYLRGLGEHGDEKLAVTQADEAVKKGFMTGGRVDQPAIMRGSEAWKAMTVAYGYSSTLWNAFSRHMAAIDSAWKNGAPLDASYLAARSFVYLFALPALTKAVTSEFLRNSPSNSTNQDREKRIASTILEEATPLKFVPIARDLAPWMINKAMGEPGRDLQFSPLESAAETLLTPLAEAAQTVTGKKTPDKLLEHSVNAISLATGVPKQANDIIFNMLDWTKTNGEVAWRDAVSRKTKK